MKGIADLKRLFFKYYSDNPALRRIVTLHSEQVAIKALDINRKKKLLLDPEEVYIAAMLHDIGVIKCNAPDIHAHGPLPYLRHGLEGEKILKRNSFDKYASICATHTGAGITANEIKSAGLPLPPVDLVPHTMLERLICYSDKFFSKSRDLKKEKSLDSVIAQMKKFGPDSYNRFMELQHLFN